MAAQNPIRRKASTEVFKLANKTMESGMHRTVNREPKGKGWVAWNQIAIAYETIGEKQEAAD